MSRRMRWVLAALASVVLAALVGRALLARRADRAQAMRPTPGLVIDLAPGDVVVATDTELTQTLQISGSLKAFASSVVKARVAADVREITVREGDRVTAGQLLGRLDDTEYRFRLRQAEQQAASARAQLQIAQRALESNRGLVDQGFISKNALDTSISTAAANDAALQAAEAAADLARKALRDTEIRAPITGTVSQRLVQPGERASVDARLLEIVDLSRLELEAALTPEDVAGLPVGAGARLQVDGVAEMVQARVARINPSTQAGTRAVIVYLAVAPQPGLRQGLFGRGAIELARSRALAVPASALRVEQARPYVIVVAAGRAAQRPVTAGLRGEAAFGNGPREPAVAVTVGLNAGDTVLRGSVGSLRDGTAVRLGGLPTAATPGAPLSAAGAVTPAR